MSSKIDVINAALYKLGVARLTSLTEDSERAVMASEIYSDQLEHVLRAHPWNFAIKRAELAELSTAPAWGADHQYELPSDCLRVLNTDADLDGDPNAWQVEGRVIVTDLDPPLMIRYVASVTDENEMDALFRELLACRLAMVLADPLTGSDAVAARMKAEYDSKLRSARGADGQEGSPPRLEATTWTIARRGGVSGVV